MAESQWRIGDEQRKPDASNANTEGECWACWNKCAMDISANVRGCDCCVTARLSRIRAALNVAGLNDCALTIKDCQPNDDVLVRVKYWEIIADNLSQAGWSYGYVSVVDSQGRTIWIADAHRDNGKRYVVRADEKLTAFLELERAIHEFAVDLIA